jgi:hypothetical protein
MKQWTPTDLKEGISLSTSLFSSYVTQYNQDTKLRFYLFFNYNAYSYSAISSKGRNMVFLMEICISGNSRNVEIC